MSLLPIESGGPPNPNQLSCKDLWTVIPEWHGRKPVCKPGACYANDLHCFLGFCLFLYVFFVGGGGEGVKGWSTAASVKHTHTHAHTFCTHRLPRQRTSAWSLQTARANNLCLLAALQTNLHREKCTSQRSLLEDGGGGGEGGHLCNFCRYILFNGETVSVI